MSFFQAPDLELTELCKLLKAVDVSLPELLVKRFLTLQLVVDFC